MERGCGAEVKEWEWEREREGVLGGVMAGEFMGGRMSVNVEVGVEGESVLVA